MSAPLENAVKELTRAVHEQNRIFKTMNENLVVLIKHLKGEEHESAGPASDL